MFGNYNFYNPDTDEFINICNQHMRCKDCPLKIQDLTIGSSTFRCNTGRDNIEENNEHD